MFTDEKSNNLFQTGVILGRITQISIDRGIVLSDSGMGLVDFLDLLQEEIKKLSLKESLAKKILDEIGNLSESIHGYTKGERIEPDDARVMVSFVSRWTDLIYDELSRQSHGQENIVNAQDECNDERMTRNGKTKQTKKTKGTNIPK